MIRSMEVPSVYALWWFLLIVLMMFLKYLSLAVFRSCLGSVVMWWGVMKNGSGGLLSRVVCHSFGV